MAVSEGRRLHREGSIDLSRPADDDLLFEDLA
jgi:hypothetical protein